MFRGDVSEYREFEPGRWRREDKDGNWLEEDGITTVSEGFTFAEIYARRAEEPKRTIAKSVIVSRLIAANKIADAKRALDANPAAFARWFASDRPAINHDDPDAIALLKAIGADPTEILAPLILPHRRLT